MNISKDEYEETRQIFDSCLWIREKLYSLKQDPNFDEIYFEFKGKNIKRLIQEAIPVSHLGLFLYGEWNEVFVKYCADIPEYDAVIEIKKPDFILTEKIKVEVTTTENDVTTMLRQALSRNGFAHLTGKVERQGRKIITRGEFVESEEENEKIIELALNRLKSKLNNAYDQTTAILVYVTSFRKFGTHNRSELIERAEKLLREKTPNIYGVFFCYSGNLGVDGIMSNSQRFNLSP